MNLHRCEITRARDTLASKSQFDLIERMAMLRDKGEYAKSAVASGSWDSVGGYPHDSNKGLATYTTTPKKVLDMCRRDYALTRLVLRERFAPK